MIIDDSTDPQRARARFKSRSLECFAAVIAIFFAMVFGISWVSAMAFTNFFPMLVGDVIALGVCYYLYLQWHDRPIKLCCRSCEAIILSNTPWVCGHCKQINRNANDFPFVHKCAHCGDEAKAYRCHHCNELIFLTEDENKLNYAYSLNSTEDEHAEKLKNLRASKEVKAEKLSIAEIDAELLLLRKRIKPQLPKKKTAKEILQEGLDADMEWEAAEQELIKAIEEKFKGNTPMIRRMKASLKDKMRRNLSGGL